MVEILFLFLFFSKFFLIFFFVGKVVRYNTALARFRDNPAIASVHSRKTCLKKLIILIIIIMKKS